MTPTAETLTTLEQQVGAGGDAGPAPAAIDAQMMRSTVGRFASGLTVITGLDGVEPAGFTCQSFYSVSVDPVLVSFSVMKSSTTYPRIRESGRLAVNVLALDQEALAAQFARSGSDKWAGVAWTPSESGVPLLDGSLAWFDCSIWAEHDAGDHTIVIAQVHSLGTAEHGEAEPLVYFKGRYRALA